MLYPIVDEYQELVKQELSITGDPPVGVHTDFFGNQVGTFTYPHPHQEMVIQSRVRVETKPREFPADDVPSDLQWKELKLLKQQLAHLDFLRPEKFEGLEDLEALVREELSRNSTPLK